MESSTGNTHKSYPSIYIIGAQCTGKTTLVLALDRYLSTKADLSLSVITEVARGLLKEISITRDEIRYDPEKSIELQDLIIEAQLRQEKLSQKSLQLSDRSGLDPIVYAKRYGPEGAANSMLNSPTWAELKLRLSSSVIIVCEPRQEWLTDDGTRLMPLNWEDWLETHHVFCSLLDQCSLKYSVLPATIHVLSERIGFVLGCWQAHSERAFG